MRFVELPDGMPAVISETAQRVVNDAGATSPYRQALALRDYFRSGLFQYDTTVDPVDTPDAIADFLRDRRGFCVQFASAYAVMARSLGIPSRVAVGFTPGEPADEQCVPRVGTRRARVARDLARRAGMDAHVRPDPARGSDRRAGRQRQPERTTTAAAVSVPGGATATTLPNQPATPAPGAPVDSTPSAPTPAAQPSVSITTSDGIPPWLVVIIALVIVVASLATYVMLVLGAKARRRARRRDAGPAAAVHGAWEEALDQLREAHVPSDPALTPLELSRVIPGRGAPAATRPLRDIARRYTSARYGNREPTADDAARAWESFDALADALEADLTWRERWRRRLDPATLRSRAGRR